MRYLISTATFFCSLASVGQPSAGTVQADLKKEFGADCITVSTLGSGSTSTDYVNGGYSTFYRVPVSVKLKTDLPGVTKLLKGAAKYGHGGGNKYFFKQYAPGTTEYLGLPSPDTAQIRAFVHTMPDYGLEGTAAVIVDVVGMRFHAAPAPLCHSLLSVSLPVDVIYTQKESSTSLETVKQPYLLRLYRKSANSAWDGVAWTTPDYRSDGRRKESLGVEQIGEYKMSKTLSLMEKAKVKAAEKEAASRPKVDVPAINSMQDLLSWYHGLLMEGDYAKVEAVTLQLFSPENFDSKIRLLDGNGAIQLDNIKKALTNDFSTYRQQYCATPLVMNSDKTGISWWNKDKSKASSITIKTENGRWYIAKVNVYIWDFYSEQRARNTMEAPCK